MAPTDATTRAGERFDGLSGIFADVYARASSDHRDELVEPEWRERNLALERALLPRPPIDFIRHPSVLHSMFVGERYVEHELPPLVRSYADATLARVLSEDPVGDPPLRPGHDGTYETSSNAIHHLHHLWRFTAETGYDVRGVDTVVEWGGGYGSLARVLWRLHGGRPTYVIVDTPLFAALQWLYLSCVLGEERVALLDAGQPVRPGCVNLVPVCRADRLDVRADLFISTWALNESPLALQDDVWGYGWFGARHILLGMHEGVPLAARAAADGAAIVRAGDWMPGQTYVVR